MNANTIATVPATLPASAVFVRAGAAFTTTITIAEVFGKRHAHVIEAVRTIIANARPAENSAGSQNQRVVGWFREYLYLDEKGQQRPAYEVTREGFSLLAMGFTGPKAQEFKVALICRFEELEAELRGRPAPLALDDPRTLRAALLGYTEHVLELQGQVAVLSPKAAALDRISASEGSECITDSAGRAAPPRH